MCVADKIRPQKNFASKENFLPKIQIQVKNKPIAVNPVDIFISTKFNENRKQRRDK